MASRQPSPRTRAGIAPALCAALGALLTSAVVTAAPGHEHGHEHRFDDPAGYAERWEDPERDGWQRPAALVEALGVQAGMTVADIGTGTGYLLPYLHRAVGSEGQVYAVDVSEEMLAWVRRRAEQEDLDTVQTVEAAPGASGLTRASVDRAIMINVWHHIADRPAYARDLHGALRDGGVLFIVESDPDSHDDGGPPRHYRLAPATVIAELKGAGFSASREDFDLDRQYVIRAER